MTQQTPPSGRPLDVLGTLDGYRERFFDAAFWTPYVRWVVSTRFGAEDVAVRAGLAGTYPTFIVDDRWVVKFFGELFDGPATHAAELTVALLRPERLGIPAPQMLAHGDLYDARDQWRWPYMVFEFMQGVSIGEAYDDLARADKVDVARDVAEMTRALHAQPIPADGAFSPTWQAYRELLDRQRSHCVESHQEWCDLPDHLIDQIDGYLAPTADLIDATRPPHVIHADITADHILGVQEADGWRTTALIDFGDAMVGDHLYELVALHLDVFQADRTLLAEYLDAYGVSEEFRAGLPHRALTTALLHRFDVVSSLAGREGDPLLAMTLDDLADSVWRIDVPE